MKVVFVTAPMEAAESLASKLVEERVAACVNVLPGVASVYRWQGRVERAQESLLVVKTSEASLGRLFARVAELHGYAVPEIVALDVARAHPPYEKWVDEECSDKRT